jgi:hypothetical protein
LIVGDLFCSGRQTENEFKNISIKILAKQAYQEVQMMLTLVAFCLLLGRIAGLQLMVQRPSSAPVRLTPSLLEDESPTPGPTDERCSNSACPTSCPDGYYATVTYSVEGLDCAVNCENEPSPGDCLSGGGGCDSSCAMEPGVIAAIVICCLVFAAGVSFLIYYFILRTLPAPKVPLSDQEVNVVRA